MNKTEILGKEIKVDWAFKKPPRRANKKKWFLNEQVMEK